MGAAMVEGRSLSSAGCSALELLWQHRLLSGGQLRRLLAPAASAPYMSGVLGELERRGLIAATRTRTRGPGKVWHLTERGGDVVAAAPPKGERRRVILSAELGGGALSAHTLAVNEVGTLFVEAACDRGDDCGPLAWRHEIQHPISAGRGRRRAESVQADALLSYAAILPDGRVALRYVFMELDRGTEAADVLAGKLRQYAQLFHYREPPADRDDPLAGEPAWRRCYPLFPDVLLILTGRPGPALERRVRLVQALARADAMCRSTPELRVWFVLLEELAAAGPFAPVFAPLSGGERVDFLGQPSLASTAAGANPDADPV